jgi:hypothetical protein
MRTNELSLNKLRGLGIFSLIAEALTLPPPGSDAIAFRDPRAAQVPAAPRPSGRGFLDRLDQWFWSGHQRHVEAYLAQAMDVHDLEARIRALERSVPHPYY